MEKVIISLKSAQDKGDDPYSLDKSKSAYHDSLDVLRVPSVALNSREIKRHFYHGDNLDIGLVVFEYE